MLATPSEFAGVTDLFCKRLFTIDTTLTCILGDKLSSQGLTLDYDNLIFNLMVKYYEEPLDFIFFALADKKRRDILMMLNTGFKTASELAEPFAISLPAISKHLKILERSGLIVREKLGRTHYFRMNPSKLDEVTDWTTYFSHFWDESINNLEHYLAEKNK